MFGTFTALLMATTHHPTMALRIPAMDMVHHHQEIRILTKSQPCLLLIVKMYPAL
jgi:hypothetical protein